MENKMESIWKMNSWQGNGKEENIKTITFCVTEDCNLACRYCYMTGKNKKNKMNYDIAVRCVDYILNNKEDFNEDSVIWEFIGGEPFLEIGLVDKICDYIKYKMFILEHPWFDSYRFSFSTNGLLYGTEKVQSYIKKNKGHLSIGISVDGNKIKHDLQRVYPNGQGSYDDVMKNVPLWIEQFPPGETKATFSHDDLPYLKDSIVSLWENGITRVSANVVFEDVWKENDDLIYEQQLNELGDYILENKLWDKYFVRFFDPNIGNPLAEEELNKCSCGSGKMLSIDCEGNFYPCIRFQDFSLNKRNGLRIGSISEGINKNKIRPFKLATNRRISKKECLKCEVATGCSWCAGFNYDEFGTIFKRADYLCKMHKANVRANKRFWRKYEQLTGEDSLRRRYEDINNKKFLQLLLDDSYPSICSYENHRTNSMKMNNDLIKQALNFADENYYEIVPIGRPTKEIIDHGYYSNLISNNEEYIKENSIVIYDNEIGYLNNKAENCILLMNKNNIDSLYNFVSKLSIYNNRVNLIITDIGTWEISDIDKYKLQLDRIIEKIVEYYNNSKQFEFSVLTDRLFLDTHSQCDAGKDTIVLAPNGKLYSCVAFYLDGKEDYSIGDINSGVLKNEMFIEENLLCESCDSYHCKGCKYLNKKYTGEYRVSPKNQCLISNIEKIKTRELQNQLKNFNSDLSDVEIKVIDTLDPYNLEV